MSSKQPDPLSLLLISDIHFGRSAASPEFSNPKSPIPSHLSGAVSMKTHLIETIKCLKTPPTFMLVLGDLTSVASPSEFTGSANLILQIASEIGLDKTRRVFFTFGNHDVDRRIFALADSTETHPEDPLYRRVASCTGGFFVQNPPALVQGPLPGSGVYDCDLFTLFVADSGYHCTPDQKIKHGKLGADQLKWLESVLQSHAETEKWRVLMVHHHPFNYPYPTTLSDISCLEEGAEVVELIGRRGVDFVCHGHRHHPKIFTELRGGWKKPTTFFCAGSLAVNEQERQSGQIPNLFHVVNLQSRLSNGGALGSVQSFEYAASCGWRPIRNSDETPLEHIHYFRAIATASERQQLISGIINKTLPTKMLPDYLDLPHELRCSSICDLNELLLQTSKLLNRRIVGKYPEPVAVFE